MASPSTLALRAERTLGFRPKLDRETAVAVLVSVSGATWDLLTVVAPDDVERATRHVRSIGMRVDTRRAFDMLLLEEPTACPVCGHDDLAVFAASEVREDEADLVECAACHWTAPLTPEGAADMAARAPLD